MIYRNALVEADEGIDLLYPAEQLPVNIQEVVASEHFLNYEEEKRVFLQALNAITPPPTSTQTPTTRR